MQNSRPPEVHGVQGERITGLPVGSDLLVGANSSFVSELQPIRLKIGMGNATLGETRRLKGRKPPQIFPRGTVSSARPAKTVERGVGL